MKQTQEQIEHLRTIQETSSFWADVAENQLPALADKIDNIKLPEIDTTELAKQGENQEATNSAILNAIKNHDAGVELFANKFREVGIDVPTDATLTDLYYIVNEYIPLLNVGIKFANSSIITTLEDAVISRLNIEELDLSKDFNFPFNSGFFQNNTTLKKVVGKKVKSIGQSAFGNCANLRYVDLENADNFGDYAFSSGSNLEYLNVASVSSVFTDMVKSCPKLIDITIGKNFSTDIDFTKGRYNPTTAYSKKTSSLCFANDIDDYGQVFSTNWDKWKWCIINHFAVNLQDRVGLDAFTITFGTTVLAQFDEDMILAFTNKNWNLA